MYSFLIIYRFLQFYVKGGLLINQQNNILTDLNLYKDKACFVSGIDKEIKLLKILSIEPGVQFINFTVKKTGNGMCKNNVSIGHPVQTKIQPVSHLHVGAGVMPIVSLSDINPGFDKKDETGGLLPLRINVIRSFML
jgi:hypothetical protein